MVPNKLCQRILVVHVGIGGYIRLIVYCRWSANNKSLTVLNLFKEAEDQYGLPLPVRTDFGMENVTLWGCILQRSRNSNAVINGSSVHNQRVERLNKDVKQHTGCQWILQLIRETGRRPHVGPIE